MPAVVCVKVVLQAVEDEIEKVGVNKLIV